MVELKRDGTTKKRYHALSFDPQQMTKAWSAVRKHTFTFLESGLAHTNLLSQHSRREIGLINEVALRLIPRAYHLGLVTVHEPLSE